MATLSKSELMRLLNVQNRSHFRQKYMTDNVIREVLATDNSTYNRIRVFDAWQTAKLREFFRI